jgi:hypothetical protein
VAESALFLAFFRGQLTVSESKGTAEFKTFEEFGYRCTPRTGVTTIVASVLVLALVFPLSPALTFVFPFGRGGGTATVAKVPASATEFRVGSDLVLTVLYCAVTREDLLKGFREVGEFPLGVVFTEAFKYVKLCLQLLGVTEDVGEGCYLSRSSISHGIDDTIISQ